MVTQITRNAGNKVFGVAEIYFNYRLYTTILFNEIGILGINRSD